jgi:hypothetical protein
MPKKMIHVVIATHAALATLAFQFQALALMQKDMASARKL